MSVVTGLGAPSKWAHANIDPYGGIGTPPTALTGSPEDSWMWRESKGGNFISKEPGQCHILDSSSHDCGTDKYPLGPIVTR
jgi:hypothetical protein